MTDRLELRGNDSALIDRAMLRDLCVECGADLVGPLVACFREEGREHLEALADAAELSDTDAARQALHALRGGAMNLGLSPLAAAAQELEDAAHNGTVPAKAQRTSLAILFERSLAAVAEEALPPS